MCLVKVGFRTALFGLYHLPNMAQNDLPPPSANNFGQRVREMLMVSLGRTGDPLDRMITVRDMLEGGLARVKSGFSLRSGMSGSLPLTPGVGAEAEPDLTPPPTPTGFEVSAAISHVFIEHDAPVYQQGGGHLRTRLYGVTHTAGQPLPTFSNAVELSQFSGVINAYPSNPSTTWRLWIKWETNDGVLSASPAGGTNGLEAKTGQDVALLLEALAGEITESQLYQDLGTRINLIDGSGAGSVNARISAEATARSTAIQTEATARADADGTLFAQYTVKLDVNGYVSGYGLASTATNAAPTSTFAVRADSFYIASPSGPGVAPSMPFIVRTTPITINGVNVPVGVYMNDAFIQNGTITNAKIANLAVDNAKIANLSADKLTAGSIAVGQHIQSANYLAGTAGWHINGNGNAEFSGVIVRGTVYASAGSIGGNSLDSSGMQSPSYAAGSSGWRLDSNGLLRAFAASGSRVLDLAATGSGSVLKIGSVIDLRADGTGTFAGALNVQSASSGARLEIKTNVIKVFDATGALRVQIGDLTV